MDTRKAGGGRNQEEDKEALVEREPQNERQGTRGTTKIYGAWIWILLLRDPAVVLKRGGRDRLSTGAGVVHMSCEGDRCTRSC